jgi:ectoine hydroxylase-related dioxygenase (phytanoyl-CoA dioxygenase family)
MEKHTLTYQVLNSHSGNPAPRNIEVHASPQELQDLATSGYLVRQKLIQAEKLDALREATDRLTEKEWDQHRGDAPPTRSWGIIMRYLMDKDPVFLDLLKFEPVLSVARAMMGPLIRMRGLTARVSFPGAEVQETSWHQHLRVVSQPLPPWFCQPHSIDALIYLDDLDDDTGPLCVLPGSHAWLDREPPNNHFGPLPDEVVLRLPAGSVVIAHSNLWHRAMPTLGRKRRMLILGYAPVWLRKSPYGTAPTDGLTRQLLEGGDDEIQELLGVKGFA